MGVRLFKINEYSALEILIMWKLELEQDKLEFVFKSYQKYKGLSYLNIYINIIYERIN